jgi:integrase
VIRLLLHNALRVDEALDADLADLGTDRGHQVLTVLGKGNRRAKVALTPATLTALRRYLDDRTSSMGACPGCGQRPSSVEDGVVLRIVDGQPVQLDQRDAALPVRPEHPNGRIQRRQRGVGNQRGRAAAPSRRPCNTQHAGRVSADVLHATARASALAAGQDRAYCRWPAEALVHCGPWPPASPVGSPVARFHR